MGVEGGKFLLELLPCIGRILQQAHAPVPAEDGIVISRGPHLLGCLEQVQRFFKERQDRGPGAAGVELGLGAPLAQNAVVIEPLVGVAELRVDAVEHRKSQAIRRVTGS